MSKHPREIVRRQLAEEQGTIFKQAPERLALIYPSPYFAAMSSLGFQTIYRQINNHAKRTAERAFLPDSILHYQRTKTPLFSYESGRPINDFPIVAFSIAYEPELAGLIESLRLAHIPLFWHERGSSDPFVLCGGPLTFSNPLPLSPFADAILLGEADHTIHQALDIIYESRDRDQALLNLARGIASCFVPAIHDVALPSRGVCGIEWLPAFSQIRTSNTELRDMFLIEAVRGCSHSCAYCVMRRSKQSGMRVVPRGTILELIPDNARRVGLVGASVSEHPEIAEIIDTLSDRGIDVGLSSLRPEAIDLRLAMSLKKAGYRTLTTALDGASQRVRKGINRKVTQEHVLQAATLAHTLRFRRLKLYLMVGLPDESDQDIDELIGFSNELSGIHPLVLSIAPFVPKRNTPLCDAPFAGIALIEARLRRLRRGIRKNVTLRPVSARWAWVEYMLAQGGPAHGLAVVEALDRGGAFRDFQRALERAE